MDQIKWIIGIITSCIVAAVAWKVIPGLLKKMKGSSTNRHWWTGRSPGQIGEIIMASIGLFTLAFAVICGGIWVIRVMYVNW
jgi:hypothetical protein